MLALALAPAAARAGSSLLYLESQAVAGYSSAAGKVVYHSAGTDDMMQKSSVGLDYIRRFSSEKGDWGSLFIESRLAWDQAAEPALQPQLYNGYFRVRTGRAYVWAGHNRVAAGLESYFDTHAALLQTLQMYGAGFDRDWGFGASRDFDWGDAAVSLTAGSGMPLSAKGNHLVSARVAEGVLARDNASKGVYFSMGKIPDVVGYEILDRTPVTYTMVGSDYAELWDGFEFRSDLRAGQRGGLPAYAALGRFGVNFLEENRLKAEVQAVFTQLNRVPDHFLAAGLTYSVTADLAARALFEYEYRGFDKRLLAQLYYYFNVR